MNAQSCNFSELVASVGPWIEQVKMRSRKLKDRWKRRISLFVGASLVVCFLAVGPVLRSDETPGYLFGQVGLVVAKLLEQHHFRGQPLNDEVSRQFFTNYLNALDYNHLFFHASDIESFKKYEETLDDNLRVANLAPAFEIFECYSNRLEQAVGLAKELLKEPFRFDGTDSFAIDRHESPWPADEKEARDLLRKRIKFELLEERLSKEKPDEIIQIITRRYDRMLRSLHETDSEAILDLYLNALAQAYDPHSQYLSPSTLEQFNIDMKLSLTGIGAVLRSEDGYAQIVEIVPGGPADLDKRLKVKDRIVGVAQGEEPYVDVVDMKLRKVVDLIRGPKGTVVRLKVIPGVATDSSTRAEIRLVRDEIKLTAQEAKAEIRLKRNGAGTELRLGYLNLPSFYVDLKKGPDSKSCTRDVAELLKKLKEQNIDGLIVDLRRNSGGSLTEAISLTGLFIKEGPVVQVKDTRGRVRTARDTDPQVGYDGPLVVLVSRLSASASEIFAAALQDYGRAVIVGDESTFGKGTVQQIVELDPLIQLKGANAKSMGALKLTIQKFYRVSGGSTQARGVVPDLQLPSILNARKLGESALPNSLPYDEVAAASYKRWTTNKLPVAELASRSRARVAANREFAYVLEDIHRLAKLEEQKTISLNEAEREAEKKATEERLEARKKERLARKVEPLKVIEVSFDNQRGGTNTIAAVTTKVLEAAAQNSRDEDIEKDDESSVDPVLDESLEILSDLIALSSNR